MHSSNEELSDTDLEDGFNEDMEALRKACQINGISPTDRHFQAPSTTGTGKYGDALLDSESDGDDDYDLALLRCIQQRFAVTTDVEEPLTLKPLCTMLPDWSDTDGCEDDFETLRAIQRRFAAYNDDSKEVDDSLQRPMKVGATIVDSEKETFSSLFVKRNNAGEGIFNCVDTSEGCGHKSQVFDDVDGTQLSDVFKGDAHGTDAEAETPHKSYQFPQAAHAFFGSILKNRSCQIHLRRKIGEMETRIQDLEKVMKDVQLLKSFQVSCKRRMGRALSLTRDARMQLISVPKQRAHAKVDGSNAPATYKGPPENPHVAKYNEALSRCPVSVNQVKWSKEERQNLLKGLKQQFQETLMKGRFQSMLFQHSVNYLSDDADGSTESKDVDSSICSIKELDITPEKIRAFLPKVDWEKLAAMYPGHSGGECQARFLNCEDPLINHNQWTPTEDINLLGILRQKGPRNWIDIAASLRTSRTPFQCLARYQRSLNVEMLKSEWTKEEDNQLRDAVETYSESNWQVVASVMERRTGPQCSNRWLKTLNPARKREGRWTLEEDKRLKVAVTLYGPKTWNKVANCVPGRTHVQCRERWVNCLDPSLNKSKWTEEEDAKLEAAIAEHGYHHWNKVAECIPRRTDNQCWRRWKTLFPHEVRLLQAARKIQKAALVSNFVDRESHRPAIGPDDFIVPYRITGPENVDPSTTKKRRSRFRRKKAKNQIKRESPSTDICSEKAPRSRNGGEVENRHSRSIKRKRSKNSYATETKAGLDEEITKSCVNDSNSKRRPHKKTSKLQHRRKSAKPCTKVVESAYEAEMRAWDETISTMKEGEKKKKSADAANCHLSSFPDSMSLVDIQKELVSVNGNKTNKRWKVLETCSKRGSVRFVGDESSIAPNQQCLSETGSAVSVDIGDSAISSENVSLRGIFSQHSAMGSNNLREYSFELNERCEKSSEMEDDDITLASFLQRNAGKKSKVESRLSPSDVLITYSRGKWKVEGGLKIGDDACKSQVVEIESEDDETLAHWYRTLKKRKM